MSLGNDTRISNPRVVRFDCRTLGASIVYAVNKLAQAKRTGALAPIVPLALTMMPLEGLSKCYLACCSS